MPILTNHRLLARAFYRISRVPKNRAAGSRELSNSAARTYSVKDEKSNSNNRTGGEPEDHVTESDESHNVQKDASREGMKERAKGQESDSAAVSERDNQKMNEKAKKEHSEAPRPVIGMNDERGGKGH